MARHWTEYTGHSLSERQVYALDAMAREHQIGDGLDALAQANGISRSKAGRQLSGGNRATARGLVDAAFQRYGRKST